MSPEDRVKRALANSYEAGAHHDQDVVQQTRSKAIDTLKRERHTIDYWKE